MSENPVSEKDGICNNYDYDGSIATPKPQEPEEIKVSVKKGKSKVKAPVDDVLKSKMASVLKTSGKVRTTQELVQEMALRSHSPGTEDYQSTLLKLGIPFHYYLDRIIVLYFVISFDSTCEHSE
jgi:hypothetical protein